jgi:uracil-DNA glycosylase
LRKLIPGIRRGRVTIACVESLERHRELVRGCSRCFPGKARGGGDRVPTRRMLANCRPHLLREFEILRPRIVVPVGGLATRELLGIGRLSEAVGETFGRDGVVFVPLPHRSGASAWLHALENRPALSRSRRWEGCWPRVESESSTPEDGG